MASNYDIKSISYDFDTFNQSFGMHIRVQFRINITFGEKTIKNIDTKKLSLFIIYNLPASIYSEVETSELNSIYMLSNVYEKNVHLYSDIYTRGSEVFAENANATKFALEFYKTKPSCSSIPFVLNLSMNVTLHTRLINFIYINIYLIY